jgi:hypothetical protein
MAIVIVNYKRTYLVKLKGRMYVEYTQVGNCATCGAPIYTLNVWTGILPPPNYPTCECYARACEEYAVTKAERARQSIIGEPLRSFHGSENSTTPTSTTPEFRFKTNAVADNSSQKLVVGDVGQTLAELLAHVLQLSSDVERLTKAVETLTSQSELRKKDA